MFYSNVITTLFMSYIAIYSKFIVFFSFVTLRFPFVHDTLTYIVLPGSTFYTV